MTTTPPRKPFSGLPTVVIVTLCGFLVPPLLGFIADQLTGPNGSLGALFMVFGVMVAGATGPIALVVSLLVVLLRRSRPREDGHRP